MHGAALATAAIRTISTRRHPRSPSLISRPAMENIERGAAALTRLLTPVQALATSGARAVETFELEGRLHVAIPQLALDIPGQAAAMNGGDSNTNTLIFRWDTDRFVACDALPVPGGEDAEFFTLGARRFLATCGVRSGRGPYSLDVEAVLYEHDGARWQRFQIFDVFAAKQWRFFTLGERHFLALAQGVTVEGTVPRHPRESRLYEWDGARFVPFQTFDGRGGYNWAFASAGARHFLAYADHVDGSQIHRWHDGRFEPMQTLAETGGRAFCFFEDAGTLWMVFANLTDTTRLYRFDGTRFEPVQTLGDAGGRELKLIDGAHGRYLVRVCFITGTPHDPQTSLMSQIYRWEHGRFELADAFPTTGGTDAAAFVVNGQRYLLVANSLTAEVRFRADTMLYRFDG
ncbi:hypothetical protein LVJ94_05430 [Pendulispora rubella]|uniref:EPTP domain-containing protein n=1 Tax=Pendulispora rubella TaxID=2741070 RepID=A0ABZ2LAS3_9BACT